MLTTIFILMIFNTLLFILGFGYIFYALRYIVARTNDIAAYKDSFTKVFETLGVILFKLTSFLGIATGKEK